jgi:hypothetical protein
MKNITRKADSSQPASETAVYLFDDWFDPIEAGVRDRVREFIQAMVEGELDAALMRPRYGRRSQWSSGDAPVGVTGHGHGHRSRSLMGTFGRIEIEVPRARLDGPDGQTTEWKSKTLRAYQRRTLAADALIASTYLAGTNTRRVRRALAALFGGAVGKDTVSRVWRRVKAFRSMTERRAAALLVMSDPFFFQSSAQLIALGARYGLPTVFWTSEIVSAGALIGYGASIPDAFRLAGTYTGRILNGASPADLPVVQPTKFELVINLTTAKALGIEVPSTLLARADEVIE